MDNFELNKRNTSLPPIKLSLNSKRKNQESLSNKLQLYIKFRTASKITINSPIESLMPSNMSHRSSSLNPTQADIVMSSLPPNLSPQNIQFYKYSRLFDMSKRKDSSFLQNSFRAQEQPKLLPKGKRLKNVLPCRIERKPLKTMKKEDLSKKSIPFLSDILNKVYRQGSKIIFSPNGPLESQDLLIEVDREKHLSEAENREIEENVTVDECLQTEEETFKAKRRVIFNKNSSFVRKEANGFGENASASSDG